MMVSVNYSASKASALRSLQATSRAMEESQMRIATGLKINSAKDNPSLWRASQALRSDIAFAAGTGDAIKIAQVQADKTSAAVGSIRKVLGEMKTLIESATAGTADRALLQKDMAAYQAQLKSLVASASMDGSNLLTGTAPSAVAIGKDKDGLALTMSLDATNLKLQSTDASGLFDTISSATWNKDTTSAKGSLFDFDLTVAGNTASGGSSPDAAASLAAMKADLAGITTKVDSLVASVAAYSKRLEVQSDFMTTISDIQETALSDMVDADLDAESARLSSLQVQQQLATTVLQLANSSQSYILKLFQ